MDLGNVKDPTSVDLSVPRPLDPEELVRCLGGGEGVFTFGSGWPRPTLTSPVP